MTRTSALSTPTAVAGFLTDIDRHLMRFTFRTKSQLRIELYDRLVIFTELGVEKSAAFFELQRRYSFNGQKPKDQMAIACAAWGNMVRQGGQGNYAEIFAGWAPPDELMLFDAGARGGTELASLRTVLANVQGRRAVVQEFASAVTLPAFYAFVGLAQFVFAGLTLVPGLSDILPIEQWSGEAAIWGRASLFMVAAWPAVVIGILLIIAGFAVALPNWAGTSRARVEGLFPFSMYRRIQTVSVLSGLTAILAAGPGLYEGLAFLAHRSTRYTRTRLLRARFFLGQGMNLGEAFHATQLNFPERGALYDIEFYDRLGKLNERLSLLTQGVERDALKAAARLGQILRIGSYLIVGISTVLLFAGPLAVSSQIQDSIDNQNGLTAN